MLLKYLLAFTLLGSAFGTSVVARKPLLLNSPAQEHQNSRRSLNDNPSGLELAGRVSSPSSVVRMTNAKRMAAGLPPLPPHRRGTRTSNAARSAPSAGGSALYGYIAAKLEGTNTLVGYVKRDYNVLGQNGLTSASNPSAGALEIILPADRTGPFNIEAEVPVMSAYPYLGFITSPGMDPDLSQYIYNYICMAGVPHTPAYSVPVDQLNSYSTGGDSALTESSIWYYDDSTGQLTAQWINSDVSIPSVFYGYKPNENVVIATGDKDEYWLHAGNSNVQWLDLYFVAA